MLDVTTTFVSLLVRRARIELAPGGFRVRCPSNEHTARKGLQSRLYHSNKSKGKR